MIDMILFFWFGLSVSFSVIGLAQLAKIGIRNTSGQIAFTILIFLLITACASFGWIMSEKHTQHKKEEVAK